MSKGEASLTELRGDDPLNPIIPLLNEMASKPEHSRSSNWHSSFDIGCTSHPITVLMPLIQSKPGFINLFQSLSVARRRPMLKTSPKTKVHH